MTAIFWDFHGTLVHPDIIWSTAMDTALRDRGFPLPIEVIREHLRAGFTWHTPHRAYPDRTGAVWWADLFQYFHRLYRQYEIPERDWSPIDAYIREYAIHPSTYTLYDDTVETLERCRQLGAANYLLSNNFPEMEPVVDGLGLSPYFAKCIVSAVVGFEKPHAGLFSLAMELAGNPMLAYMVGDNPVADIHGGNAAGMRTIHVHPHKGEHCTPRHTCDNLSDIPAIVSAAMASHRHTPAFP